MIFFAIPFFVIGLCFIYLLFSFFYNSLNFGENEEETKKINLKVQIPFIKRNINFALSGVLGFVLINLGFFLLYSSMWDTNNFNISIGNFSNYFFIDSVYYTITTGTTLGYGDIVPISSWARILSTLQQLLNLIEVGIVIYGFGKGGGWLIGKNGGRGPGSGPIKPKDLDGLSGRIEKKFNEINNKLSKIQINSESERRLRRIDFEEFMFRNKSEREKILNYLKENRNKDNVSEEELLDKVLIRFFRYW